ncbi:hypothetical protein [Pseudomonas sp. GV071]|uniref:hypothetical protein n=1 Tax=Pseudomonas sp. GV071 TaxID=2135754 RepID=UPI000D3A55EA|nr:hypothetical protein [Pseudomonas sp. GV071]PTQ72179.1 hypothetical protein C8K61_103106 [Pseudomonas sp. GV071]
MKTEDFINNIRVLSDDNLHIKMYQIDDQVKVYGRFLERMFWMSDAPLKHGWLEQLYRYSNGLDLSTYYIVPYNNFFNKKKFSFDDFCNEWIVNQDNSNEVLCDFYSFMTDGVSLIGYLENLKDNQGDNFIGFSSESKNIKDVDIIFSNIYSLYDYVIGSLKEDKRLNFFKPIEFWRERDIELDSAYKDKRIIDYKMRFLFQDGSVNFNNH